MAGPKIPRASISIGHLDDPAYQLLTTMENGWEAWGIFVSLITRAKSMRNDGVFKTGSNGIQTVFKVVSRAIGCDATQLQRAFDTISTACEAVGTRNWLVVADNSLTIRSYLKWNDGRGGARANTGPKPKRAKSGDSKRIQNGFKTDSNDIQNEFKDDSNMAPSVSVTVTKEEDRAKALGKPDQNQNGKPKPRAQWNDKLVAAIQSTLVEPPSATEKRKITSELYKRTGELARKYTEAVVRDTESVIRDTAFDSAKQAIAYIASICAKNRNTNHEPVPDIIGMDQDPYMGMLG